VNYYNHWCYHESLDNLTSTDVFYGRREVILNKLKQIKQATMAMRRQMHYDRQTKQPNLMSLITS
jgi:putative transposase